LKHILSTEHELGGYQDLQVEIHLDHGFGLRNSDSKAQRVQIDSYEQAEDDINNSSIRLEDGTYADMDLLK